MMDDPLTEWLQELREGERDAAGKLWKHFHAQLEQLARQRLPATTKRVYDEQDAAQSAFASFCKGISAGRYPDLTDGDALRRMLLVITARKITHRQRYDHRECRDVRRLANYGIFAKLTRFRPRTSQPAAREPTPDFVAVLSETCEQLLQPLGEDQFRQIALAKLEGYTDTEIAHRCSCSLRTIQRRLEMIRRCWAQHHSSPVTD